jgi:hypothetical protein
MKNTVVGSFEFDRPTANQTDQLDSHLRQASPAFNVMGRAFCTGYFLTHSGLIFLEAVQHENGLVVLGAQHAFCKPPQLCIPAKFQRNLTQLHSTFAVGNHTFYEINVSIAPDRVILWPDRWCFNR